MRGCETLNRTVEECLVNPLDKYAARFYPSRLWVVLGLSPPLLGHLTRHTAQGAEHFVRRGSS